MKKVLLKGRWPDDQVLVVEDNGKTVEELGAILCDSPPINLILRLANRMLAAEDKLIELGYEKR